jgi:hypothetical protein
MSVWFRSGCRKFFVRLARPTFRVEKVALFCNPASGGTFSSTAIEIIKWVNFFAVAQAKVSYILRPGKASEKTPKRVIPPSLCEISQNASKKSSTLLHRFLLYSTVLFFVSDSHSTLAR